jgi:hypothetical protein
MITLLVYSDKPYFYPSHLAVNARSDKILTGAGAAFPQPLYGKGIKRLRI